MAKAKEKQQKPPADFGDYFLVNHDKLDRAINGSAGPQGRLTGGVGKDATQQEILAAYDRLGGLILTRNGEKVKMGSFYDFEKGQPREVATPKLAEVRSEKDSPTVKTEEVDDEGPVVKKARRKSKLD